MAIGDIPLPLTFGWEPIERLLAAPNACGMIRSQYIETGNPDIPLDIDWQAKVALEAAGRMRVWAARADGTLAGFICWHITGHLNYRSTLMAITDTHCLDPAFRDIPRIGWRMWRTSEIALRELGVKVILAHDDGARSLLPWFLALGMRPSMTIFEKVLK